MGTNYYLEEVPPCTCCGRPFPSLHIGKSSAGWTFALHVDPELKITTLDDWKERWSRDGVRVINEYGDTLTPDEMLKVITERKGNLNRRYGDYVLGHGEGTWDYILGEFS